ncbi:glycosyl hydrolase family 98 [Neorhodopirellula pilleata]|nr:glycosyl hydrolase family 98 [Neorhodopirellula pilleata]
MIDPRLRFVFARRGFVIWIGLFAIGVVSESTAATVEVAVVTADGESVTGGLAEMSDVAIALDLGSEVRTIPLENASRIDFSHSSLPPLPTVVELRSGSKIRVSQVTWDGDDLKLTPSRQAPLTLPVARLRSIRYRTGNPATDTTWLGWNEDARRGDRLAVRRDEKTLDSIDGTVVGIGPQTVQFEMAGNTIAAPIAKLEGILFSSTNPNAESPADPIRVVDTSGSQYLAASVRLAPESEHLDIQLPGQIGHSIPLDQVMSIGFAGGVLRLVEAEVASSRFLAGQNSDAFPAWMQNWFEPRAGEEGSDDSDVVLMRSPSEIRFRIPEGYEKLKVAVRRHPEVDWFLPVGVEVLTDEEVVWSATLEDRESLGLELELGDARTVTLRTSSIGRERDSTTSADPTKDRSNSLLPHQLGGQIQWFGGRLLK